MNTVQLKNGTEEVAPLVSGGMLLLESLFNEQPMIFYELVMLARDPNHLLWGDSARQLEKRALLVNGRLHDSFRNLILSAVTGDDLAMELGSPYEEEEK